jgi:DNA-binding MarR family transcriptional regulator
MMMIDQAASPISDGKVQALANFRFAIRKFLHFSEEAAIRAGVAPQQHQLMLQISGASPGTVTSIGYMADRLCLRHHSAVELARRCEEAGLITRRRDPTNRRQVVLELLPAGSRILRQLSSEHHRELNELGPRLIRALSDLLT